MTAAETLAIIGPTIYAEKKRISQGMILISSEMIQEIDENLAVPKEAKILTYPSEYSLIPGLIDMHIHGAIGKDMMDADPKSLQAICEHLPSEGVTAFLATTMTAPPQKIEAALLAVRKYAEQGGGGAEILGVHLEGPFLAKEQKGAQKEEFLVPPDFALFQRWQRASGHRIKLVTFAPELPGADTFLRSLKKEGILCSLGHSNATYEQALHAIEEGCTHATHLFNAMSGMHHRAPGASLAVLFSKKVMAEIIADGIHVHPAIIKLAYAMKGKDHLVLITDAMRGKGMKEGGCCMLGGQEVIVHGKEARLKDGALAGSLLSLNEGMINMMAFTGCSLEEAIAMAAENPAKELSVFDRKGSLAKGKEADLVVLDEKKRPVLTLCKGRIAYQSPSRCKFS